MLSRFYADTQGSLSLVAQYLISETIDIRIPYPNGTIPWSVKEKQRLMNAYGKASKTALNLLFPDRTNQSLQTKASRLKIPRPNKRYTDKEDKLLCELKQKKLTYNEMVPYFQYRSINSLRTRYSRIRR